MAIANQEVSERYAIYEGDCCEVLPTLPDRSIHLTVYSPPFCGLYNYSSSENDMSNCRTYAEFFEHYEFLVRHIARVTMRGRLTAVHCMDVGGKDGGIIDFPGDIIRLHQKLGFRYHARFAIWKEPLRVAIRTRSKGLTHRQIVKDSSFSNNAGADYLLVFRNAGENPVPIAHPAGLTKYAGEREVPDYFTDAKGVSHPAGDYRNWRDPQTNKLAHWIWQQYASSFWDDIRNNRVLPYKAARDKDDEKHVHPLQLDVIERCVLLWSNPDETVLTPFMGVGSEVCGALMNGRKSIGIELKPSYFRQARRNIASVLERGWGDENEHPSLFADVDADSDIEELEAIA
jgi:DNA modification methylase